MQQTLWNAEKMFCYILLLSMLSFALSIKNDLVMVTLLSIVDLFDKISKLVLGSIHLFYQFLPPLSSSTFPYTFCVPLTSFCPYPKHCITPDIDTPFLKIKNWNSSNIATSTIVKSRVQASLTIYNISTKFQVCPLFLSETNIYVVFKR